MDNAGKKNPTLVQGPQPRLASWVEPFKAATEEMDSSISLEKDNLDLAADWAILGIFLILALSAVYMMSLILIPVTLAVVVGMILGQLADKLGRLGVPRLVVAPLLSAAVALLVFLIINSLLGPLGTLAEQGPTVAQHAFDRSVAYLESIRWLHITPQTFQSSGPIQIGALLENTGNVLHVVTNNLTPALVQILIFFAALLLFLFARANLRKSLILVFPTRDQRLAAIRVINGVEQVLGYYFATASVIYAALGVFMTLVAFVGGLSAPVLWGVFAFLACFIPFLGITAITAAVAIAGLMTHDSFLLGLAPAAVFFCGHVVMENLLFPAVMGKQLDMNPFMVFVAILFWTWMWGAIGAMLALPLSLVVMTVISELFIEEKPQPQLPK
ncbi:AI-2E family transporter [Rhizobium sp. RAF56]|uniref:AI-2E family transporter n=1 Tax=Rhizobium sp. RAF56 TaxID=3233062 RepID=UPI003F9C23EA